MSGMGGGSSRGISSYDRCADDEIGLGVRCNHLISLYNNIMKVQVS